MTLFASMYSAIYTYFCLYEWLVMALCLSALACDADLKERYSYVCPDVVKEFQKYDQDPKWIKQVCIR